jgi:hypothetical protein
MPDIDKIANRPRVYLSETGMPQLMSGLIFVVLGATVLIQQVLVKGPVAQLITQWIGVFCAGAVLWGARALRRRIVFPRCGYAEPRVAPASRFFFWGSMAAIVALGIFAIAMPGQLQHMEPRLIAPGFGILFAILLLATGRRQKSALMMWFGIYFIALARLLWWMPGTNYELMSALQVGAGLPLAVFGALRLRSFLKANPMPMEPANG